MSLPFFVFRRLSVPFEGSTEYTVSGSACYVVESSHFGKEATFVSVLLTDAERKGETVGPDGPLNGLTPDGWERLADAVVERLNRDAPVREELAKDWKDY
jgi:hypothetical protein